MWGGYVVMYPNSLALRGTFPRTVLHAHNDTAAGSACGHTLILNTAISYGHIQVLSFYIKKILLLQCVR